MDFSLFISSIKSNSKYKDSIEKILFFVLNMLKIIYYIML